MKYSLGPLFSFLSHHDHSVLTCQERFCYRIRRLRCIIEARLFLEKPSLFNHIFLIRNLHPHNKCWSLTHPTNRRWDAHLQTPSLNTRTAPKSCIELSPHKSSRSVPKFKEGLFYFFASERKTFNPPIRFVAPHLPQLWNKDAKQCVGGELVACHQQSLSQSLMLILQ